MLRPTHEKGPPCREQSEPQTAPAEVAASPVTTEKRRRHRLVPAAERHGLRPMQPCRGDDVVPDISQMESSSKDDRDMAPRPSVTRHPFTLMFVVIALLAPFAGLAWRTREWMGW